MISTIDKLLRRALLADDDIATISDVAAVRRKLGAAKIDIHTVSITPTTPPANTIATAMRMVAAADDARRDAERKLAIAEATIARLEDDLTHLRQSRRVQPINHGATVTEWVRRTTYTPRQAEAEKVRINLAHDAGKLTKLEAARHRGWVTRRTPKDTG